MQNFVISPDTIAKKYDEQPPTPIDSLSSTDYEKSNDVEPETKSVSKLKNTQDLEGPPVDDDVSSENSYGRALRQRQSTVRKGRRGGSLNQVDYAQIK